MCVCVNAQHDVYVVPPICLLLSIPFAGNLGMYTLVTCETENGSNWDCRMYEWLISFVDNARLPRHFFTPWKYCN